MQTPCWKCREPVEGPVCVGCGAVQPPPAQADYFVLLGIPRRYHLDEVGLEAAWRDRSRRVHPDRHVGASAVERRMSLQWTALLNEARRVLRRPLTRARYLATGQGGATEARGPNPDPEFLERVFAWRMAADAGTAGVREEAEALRAELAADLDDVFTRWEAGEGDLSRVEGLLARLRYLDNLR